MANWRRLGDRFMIGVSRSLHYDYHKKRNWYQLILELRGSVIPAILPRVILCALLALVVSIMYSRGVEQVSIQLFGSLVPTVVLGLLLVFRTNTAYSRFWDGSKLWGTIVNTSRNLARGIWLYVIESKPEHRREKNEMLRLLTAFSISTKLRLRSEDLNQEVASLVPAESFDYLRTCNHPPLEIIFWLSNYLQKEYENQRINAYQLTELQKLIDTLVESMAGCERILNTPLPLAYAIHLRQLVILYCLSLPFQVVDELLWLTVPFVAIISFTVFGIEQIGLEIENPFGYDPNDLPLDRICRTLQANINDLTNFEPSVKYWN